MMQGLPKSCGGANSCRTSKKRRQTFELESYDLYHAVFFGMAVGLKAFTPDKAERVQRIWEEHVWPRIKTSKSYTVRVNGRKTIDRGVIVNKRTRAQVERKRLER